MRKTVIVTGGAGFIGSAVVRLLIRESPYRVVNVDKLTYAGSIDNVAEVKGDERYVFERADICDAASIEQIFRRYDPDAVLHLAAESHVDRSIDGPRPFIDSNIIGTYVLLEAARRQIERRSATAGAAAESGPSDFRFVHVSTDEVFGSLGRTGNFDETTPYDPSSPYSASKASADHLARAWHRTFGVPVVVTNCSNNYGPFQYPEKLIPVVILNLVAGASVPVYGKGDNVRDWLYVEDHARALLQALERGEPGETYVVGSRNEQTNLDLVYQICEIMDELAPREGGASHRDRVTFVEDRPGHDFRYAIDPSHIENELGWKPKFAHEEALRATVKWYLDNADWCDRRLGRRRDGSDKALERIGLAKGATSQGTS